MHRDGNSSFVFSIWFSGNYDGNVSDLFYSSILRKARCNLYSSLNLCSLFVSQSYVPFFMDLTKILISLLIWNRGIGNLHLFMHHPESLISDPAPVDKRNLQVMA